MLYHITAIKRDTMPKRDGGTWVKVSVKAQETGEQVLELGNGHDKRVKDYLKAGDTVVGYIENRQWAGSDGQPRFTPTLHGITPQYLHKLILAIDPGIEAKVNGQAAATVSAPVAKVAPKLPASSWETPAVEYPADDINPEDIPF